MNYTEECLNPNHSDNGSVLLAVGVYIAIASFYFVVVFGADVRSRYVQGKPWYPTKYISLNAISLTALSIAIKIPTDLTTPMIEPLEQFSKLTGSILVCISMANTMPSLGGMDGTYTIISNVSALIIVVITLIVDIGIQIMTHIIYSLWREQIIVMVLISLHLFFIVSTAVVVQTTKELMERQFQAKQNQHSEVMLAEDEEEENYLGKVKENIVKNWFMAHTSNPQYVIARSPICIASGGLCLVTIVVMVIGLFKTFQGKDFCNDAQKSGYKFGVMLGIVLIQILAIILGSIGPVSRCMWWSEVVFKNCYLCTDWKESIKYIIKVEEYWVSSLEKWKEEPLFMNYNQRWIRKIIRFFKWWILTILAKLQIVIVMVCKLIRAVSIIPMLILHKILQLIFHRYFFLFTTTLFTVRAIIVAISRKNIVFMSALVYISPYYFVFLMRVYLVRLKQKFQFDTISSMEEHQPSMSSSYVLRLEGETGLVGFIVQESHNNERNNKNKKKEKNAMLMQLIKNHSTLDEGFRFVTDFRAITESTSHPDLLRCSWALPLVTLSCIAITLPGVDRIQVQLLLKAVNRGLKFVRLIEQSINDRLLINMRDAAEFVWLGIDLDQKWLDFNLQTFIIHSEDKDAREVVEDLGRIATNHILEFKNRAEDIWNRPYEWPPKVLAGDCMQTISTTILQNYDQYGTNMTLFQWLRTTIADILGACLTNLPEVIQMECSKKSIEVREEAVWNAANLFAETENLLELLYDPVVAWRFPERKKNIEEWESRGVIVATDISAMEDLSVHSEHLDGVVIEVDTASEYISGVQRM